MMSNYSLRHKEKRESLFTKTFVGALFIVGILIAVHFFFPSALSGAARFISAPLWKIKNLTTENFANSIQLLRSKKTLVEENQNLKAQIKANDLKFLELDLFKEENIALKELFDRQTLNAEDTVMGTVLARPSASVYDTFVIDIGSNAGVRKGDIAFVSGDIYLGIIDEVNRRTSVVKLFSSPGQETAVLIGKENIAAAAEGRGGGNFVVKLPRGTGVEKGDIITMPDISARIFAVVEEIESDPSDPFITVLFKNPVNMNEIKWVQIVTENQSQ